MREQAGVSQAVFARAFNVTTDDVSNIKRGVKRLALKLQGNRLRTGLRVEISIPNR